MKLVQIQLPKFEVFCFLPDCVKYAIGGYKGELLDEIKRDIL